jgi:small-conductance mechanosensitive channel
MSEFDLVDGNEAAPEVEGGNEAAPQENTIPYQRFEQVYGKMKEYETQIQRFKEFGDPSTVKEQLAKLKQWEKAVDEQRRQAAQTPDEKSEAQRAAQIKKELVKVYPELADISTVKELKAAIDELRNASADSKTEAVLKDMSSKFSETMKAAKIDTKYQSKIEEYIVSQMTKEEQGEFVKGNYEVAKRIFDNELKDGLFASMRAKPNLQAPAMRNTPGGTPPQGKVAKAKTLQEASDEGWNRINGG